MKSINILAVGLVTILIWFPQSSQADEDIRFQLVNLNQDYGIEPDLPWVDESILAETHGRGYQATINQIETEIGVILWDEVSGGNKEGRSINMQMQGTGTVQSTSLIISK